MAFAAKADKAHEAKFRWVTGEPVNYKNWSDGEPDNGNRWQDCAIINKFGQWDDINGEHDESTNKSKRKIRGVYERKTVPPKDSTIEWLRSERNLGGTGHWYGINTNGMSWMNHKEAAEKLGGYLATISSVEENSFVFSITEKYGAAWIGLALPSASAGAGGGGGGGGGGGSSGGGSSGGGSSGGGSSGGGSSGGGSSGGGSSGGGRLNLTGRGAGYQQMPATSPTRSAPQQVQGTPTRKSLRLPSL